MPTNSFSPPHSAFEEIIQAILHDLGAREYRNICKAMSQMANFAFLLQIMPHRRLVSMTALTVKVTSWPQGRRLVDFNNIKWALGSQQCNTVVYSRVPCTRTFYSFGELFLAIITLVVRLQYSRPCKQSDAESVFKLKYATA